MEPSHSNSPRKRWKQEWYTGNNSKYNVNLNISEDKKRADVTVFPSDLQNICCADGDKCFLSSTQLFTSQQVVGSKYSNFHYRPCLPNETYDSTCTPRAVWRPSLPPSVRTCGRKTHTEDKLGSTWAYTKPNLEDGIRSFNRGWVVQAGKGKKHQSPAGKESEYNTSLLFPGSHFTIVRSVYPNGKNIGDVVLNVNPRVGDVLILPCFSKTSRSDPRGYVGFVHNGFGGGRMLDGGTMLLRLAKFGESRFPKYGETPKLRSRKQLKLFLLTVKQEWRLKGVLTTAGYLEDPCVPSNFKKVPLRYRQALEANTVDTQCIPQRGDVIIREPWKDLCPCWTDTRSSLLWWQPGLELDLNDLLVRACMWNCCGSVEGFVDLYCYNGKGLLWVFIGRDETIFEPHKLNRDSDTSDDEKLAADPRPLARTSSLTLLMEFCPRIKLPKI